jgi:hypothetical protein
MRISHVCACVFLVYAHDTPPRVQHFSAFHYGCSDIIIVVGVQIKPCLQYTGLAHIIVQHCNNAVVCVYFASYHYIALHVL